MGFKLYELWYYIYIIYKIEIYQILIYFINQLKSIKYNTFLKKK